MSERLSAEEWMKLPLNERAALLLEASEKLWEGDARLWPHADQYLKPTIAELRSLPDAGEGEPVDGWKMGQILVDATWQRCVGVCIEDCVRTGTQCRREFISRERFDEHIAPLLTRLAASEARVKRFVIDTCEHGHDYAKLDGQQTRCPICLATGLATARSDLDAALAAVRDAGRWMPGHFESEWREKHAAIIAASGGVEK